MSVLTIQPQKLSGELAAPPSKSVAHRAIIAAALARGESVVSNLELSDDITATLCAVRALGARAELRGPEGGRREALIKGLENGAAAPLIDCKESGSTLRFLIPVALAVSGGAVFTGAGRLGQRPLGPYLDIFKAQGIRAEYAEGGGFPLAVSGRLQPGEFTVPGGVSSQFITGLLLALPQLSGDSRILIKGNLESIGYVDITLGVLEAFGITVLQEGRGRRYFIPGKQCFGARNYNIEGDWSQAAFLLLMGLSGGPVTITGLDRNSRQGDRVIEAVFRQMGGDLTWQGETLVARASKLYAATVDVSQCPDLAPAIAAAMAVAQGESRIVGGRRLRDKESDRIASIAACLNALGAKVEPTEDGLRIIGVQTLKGGEASTANDHRIAMMAAGVSPLCIEPIALGGWETVAKSWPGFWEDFAKLGGACHG